MKSKEWHSDGSGLVYRGPFVYGRSAGGTLTFGSAAITGGRITSAGVQYHVTDHLGSVVAVVNGSDGSVVEAGKYADYGSRTDIVAAGTPTAATNRWHFSGKQNQDVDFGIKYTDFGARLYSSGLGRWIVPDPASEKYYDVSPYAYCANNPVNLVDPDGKNPFVLPFLLKEMIKGAIVVYASWASIYALYEYTKNSDSEYASLNNDYGSGKRWQDKNDKDDVDNYYKKWLKTQESIDNNYPNNLDPNQQPDWNGSNRPLKTIMDFLYFLKSIDYLLQKNETDSSNREIDNTSIKPDSQNDSEEKKEEYDWSIPWNQYIQQSL